MKKIILKSVLIFLLFIFILSFFLGCKTISKTVLESELMDATSDISKKENQQSQSQESEAAKTDSSETATLQSDDTTSATETAGILDKSKFLTVADVEKVSGETGIKLIDYNPSIGAGGDLNFAKSDGTMFLLAQVQEKSFIWDEWKKQEGFFNEAVPGVGDEAYNGPKGTGAKYVLFFYKGDLAFSLSSFFNLSEGGKPYFTQDQLIELAKIMLSRQ
ncbi:MAG: hypothetical protein M1371_08320 [Actinobacteria bacterium]|nr:hypothetical protein [Actinomycetota bacterium]